MFHEQKVSWNIMVKSLAGDLLSLNCSPDDSLLDLKRQIAAAAASWLGLDWPVAQQKLMVMSDSASDESGGGDLEQADDGFLMLQDDAMSLQSQRIRDGDVLAVLIEDQVRTRTPFLPLLSRMSALSLLFSI